METTQTPSNDRTQPAMLPIDQIDIQQGFNPRRHFGHDALNDQIESLKAQGVIQSVLVRPGGQGRYHLVPGERRYRAAKQAGLTELPVQVRSLDDQAALAAATAENGDRDEAAKLLGWKRSRVDARLMLLHARDEVPDALERSQNKVGHAELLSTLPTAVHPRTDPRTLRNQRLSGGPFNSSTQASLFDFSVGAGRCSNHECSTQKNSEHVAQVVTEQRVDSTPCVAHIASH